MRVLFATNHAYLPQRVGGSESSTHDLCLSLQDFGVDVAVLSSLSSSWLLDKRRLLPLFARHRGRLVRDEGPGYPVFRATAPAAWVDDLVRSLRPDIAVVQAGRPLVLAERFAALDIPCIVYLRDALFRDLGAPLCLSRYVRYVATSRDLARRFESAFGISPVRIAPLVRPTAYQVQSRRTNVTFVCPCALKGIDIALGLAARRPDIPFVFLESWPLNPPRRLLLRWTIRGASNITLLPPTHDMRNIYGMAKVVLVPSRLPEGWGRVVSEAQVSGIPALASNRGGLPEAVGEGGITVDPDASLDEWARALARLWDDDVEYERLAERARQHACRPEFQPPAIASQLLAVLSEAATLKEIGELAN